MPKAPTPDLRELAKERLRRLQVPSPGALEKEIEEARQQGYKLICAPGIRVWIPDDSLEVLENGEHE